MSQDRSRTALGSPQLPSHALSASAYAYGQNNSNIPPAFAISSAQTLNDALAQSRPQYQPGYLLSLAQSQVTPTSGQRHEEPHLIPTRAKLNTAYSRNAPTDFGSDSMFETASKSRHRENADDEDGPPTMSVVDIINEVHVDPHRMKPQSFSRSRHSISAPKSDNGTTSSSATHQPLYVIVFGYPPSRYSSTTAHFQSIADGGTTEPEHSLDVENAFKIGYRQPWEAARAWRRNGEIISGDGGRWMVGVKWVDPMVAEQILGSGARSALSSSPFTGPELSQQQSSDQMDMSADAEFSQLQHAITPSIGKPIQVAPSTAAFRKATLAVGRKDAGMQMGSASRNSPAKGMFGQVSDLIFGW